MADLLQCYQDLIQDVPWCPEEEKVIRSSEELRQFWKPTDGVELLLLAESHVYTTVDDWKVGIRHWKLHELHCPMQFLRQVYCLGYGDNTVVGKRLLYNNRGTPEFWGILRSCFEKDSSMEKGRAMNPDQKIKLLLDMKHNGIWLVDASIAALYGYDSEGNLLQDYRQKDPELYKTLIKKSWNGYVKQQIREARPKKIVVIGKTVWDELTVELAGYDADWVYEPRYYASVDPTPPASRSPYRMWERLTHKKLKR